MNALRLFTRLSQGAGCAILGLALLGHDAVAGEAPLTLGEPTIIPLASPPRDLGHRESFAELKALLPGRAERLPGDSSAKGAAGPRPVLSHPMRKGITNSRPGFYAIANYVDQDEAAPDQLLDYECGERTYDLEDGTNHNGVDYFNWPFQWLSMQQDASIVVAAADGTIVQKRDGQPDMNCAFNENTQANQVVLEHADGSITIYAHLKQGSTTARQVGDSVERGDYLAVVGSSGLSTGPHLHFGVMDSGGGLIEPHAGECNSLNLESWWQNQEDYFVPTINLIATHSNLPEFPPCPGVEQTRVDNTFQLGATVFFSVFFRDSLMGETANMEVRDPNGIQILSWTFDLEDAEHFAGLMVVWSVQFSGSEPSGAYRYRATYGGNALEHTFYIDSAPNPPPAATPANNAYNGLWFDPALEGEGYNFVTASAGTVIYFYGSDQFGNRLWLLSDLINGAFGTGAPIVVTMYESTGGSFATPVPSARGLSVWGTLTIQFASCTSGVATLEGADGDKVSQIVKLAGVAGTQCTGGGASPDSPWSGLWYDTGDEGEGYNLVVAPNGSILYYYGFQAGGDRLWLISDLIVELLEIGKAVEAPVYEATQGTFASPVPSGEALVQWGTATITLIDCSHVTIELTGNDGSKTSSTVRLAGIIGLGCAA